MTGNEDADLAAQECALKEECDSILRMAKDPDPDEKRRFDRATKKLQEIRAARLKIAKGEQ